VSNEQEARAALLRTLYGRGAQLIQPEIGKAKQFIEKFKEAMLIESKRVKAFCEWLKNYMEP
jgi:hypothetical protein